MEEIDNSQMNEMCLVNQTKLVIGSMVARIPRTIETISLELTLAYFQ